MTPQTTQVILKALYRTEDNGTFYAAHMRCCKSTNGWKKISPILHMAFKFVFIYSFGSLDVYKTWRFFLDINKSRCQNIYHQTRQYTIF